MQATLGIPSVLQAASSLFRESLDVGAEHARSIVHQKLIRRVPITTLGPALYDENYSFAAPGPLLAMVTIDLTKDSDDEPSKQAASVAPAPAPKRRKKDVLDSSSDENGDDEPVAAPPPAPKAPSSPVTQLKFRAFGVMTCRERSLGTAYAPPAAHWVPVIEGDEVMFVPRGSLTPVRKGQYDSNFFPNTKPENLAVLTRGGAAGDDWRVLGLSSPSTRSPRGTPWPLDRRRGSTSRRTCVSPEASRVRQHVLSAFPGERHREATPSCRQSLQCAVVTHSRSVLEGLAQ